MPENPPIKVIVDNRKAKFEYTLSDSFEAGIELVGSEVKSLRAGRANLQEAYVKLDKGQAWLMGCHISPYAEANRNNHDPVRPRRLLLHAQEIDKIAKAVEQKGMTAVPRRLYFKGSWVKVEVALGKGKKLHDKRESIKNRDVQRDLARYK